MKETTNNEEKENCIFNPLDSCLKAPQDPGPWCPSSNLWAPKPEGERRPSGNDGGGSAKLAFLVEAKAVYGARRDGAGQRGIVGGDGVAEVGCAMAAEGEEGVVRA
ncbi:hypothetical protein Pyn_18697 [Prunus yedoensis var. nudiflora]|uniref:Uncharacterized protein n=1 Tax=Prunus yedoensis var. nudiflora TaxID=2094558 RepID=A0A314XRY9_PRUYE|nr:hypothetical protein Pyn_18697 [Prunus yedoensis var. nudiflora]